jgi:HAMP domain-containing protein
MKMLVDVQEYHALEEIAQNVAAMQASHHPTQALRNLERAAEMAEKLYSDSIKYVATCRPV